MPRGDGGQTCAEAIRASIGPEETASASLLFERTQKLGAWKDETIWQHPMSLIANFRRWSLPAARDGAEEEAHRPSKGGALEIDDVWESPRSFVGRGPFLGAPRPLRSTSS